MPPTVIIYNIMCDNTMKLTINTIKQKKIRRFFKNAEKNSDEIGKKHI